MLEQLEEALKKAQGQRPRHAVLLKHSKGEVRADGREVLNAPGQWHFMISYCQRARMPPQIAVNLASYLRAQGCSVWLDVSMLRKDVAAMQRQWRTR